MTLEEIKKAVEDGKTVHYGNNSHKVIEDSIGQWMIKCVNGSCIGLTWADDVTLNGTSELFYIQDCQKRGYVKMVAV